MEKAHSERKTPRRVERLFRLPGFAPDAAGPGPADAEANEHAFHARLEATLAAQFVDGDRNGGGNRVAAIAEDDGEFVDLHLKCVSQEHQHLVGGLMEDVEVNLFGRQSIGGENIFDETRDGADGEVDERGAIHIKLAGPAMAMARLNGCLRFAGAALVHNQRVGAAAIGAEVISGKSRCRRGFNEGSGGGVAKDRAEAAVGRVDVFGIGFCGDKEDAFDCAGANEAIGQGKAVNKSGAAEVKVEGAAIGAKA